MPIGFDKFAEGVGKTIETVPEFYNDGLKPATQESGKTLALLPRTINAALIPLRMWIAKKEYNLTELEKLLAKKLEHVDENKIVTPEPYVAIPAIQAISYSMDSKELRNLYANILAKSMNSDTKDFVHPSFVEIIKQLTPLDSLIFNHISTKMRTPVINLSLSTNDSDNSRNNWIKNITDFTFSEDYKLISISIDNLLRLGLIEIPYKRKITDITQYDSVRNSIHFKKAKIRLQKLIAKGIGKKIKMQLNYIQKTSLGIAFKEICVDD
ncbi:DUF4393 domain-containing protein [Lacrimispora sp.]|uniref:DUF4393 domain-containing protein n=1 Tax=Lacrimispora sp. TaxID=2719234 RepID=UPI0032E3EED4